MIQTGEKLRVFISSKTGDDSASIKYNLARKAIKELLESTGIFQIYLFEEAGTSSTSAFNHYIQRLKNADVCIFLIDNVDGVPQGVQNEVDEVLKNNTPSLYYFCDQYSKEKTSLQKRLLHAHAPKNKNIHSFEDFIQRGTTDLIDDILSVYRAYGSGNIIHPSNNLLLDETNDGNENEQEEKKEKLTVPRALLINNKQINKEQCRQYFINMFLGKDQTGNVSSSKSVDYYCSTFLPVMLKGSSYDNFEVSAYLKKLQDLLPKAYFEVVKLRWRAISAYYQNNLSESIEILKKVYKDSLSYKIEEWFIQDVLIDLRNQINLYHEKKNEFTNQNFGQIELDKRKTILFYPNIDRYEKNLLEQLEKDRQKLAIELYSSKTILVDRSIYTNKIADIFFEAMIFGSMSHLIRIHSIIQNLSYEWFVRNDEWEMFKLNFMNTIMTLDKKKVHRMARTFANHVENLTQEEAKEIYDYAENQILNHHKLIAQLLAISEVGYYLSDNDFSNIWNKLEIKLNDWKNSESSIVNLESYIFHALKHIKDRVDQNYLIEFCLSIMKSNSVRYHDSAIEFLCRSIDYNNINYVVIKNLNNYVLDILENESNSIQDHFIKILCCNLRKIINSAEIHELNSKIQNKWPEFYELEYCIEINKSESVITLLLEKQLATIKYRNNTQGKNGSYSGYSDSPFLTIKNILSSNEAIISSQELIDDIFRATSTTILDSKQTVTDKIQAYKLLYTLCRIDKNVIYRNNQVVEALINIGGNIDAYELMLSYVQKQVLVLAHYLLLSLFQKDVWVSILNELSSYDDEGSQVEACKLIKSYLVKEDNFETSSSILGILFQFSLIWINSASLNLRWHSVHLLIILLNVEEYAETITNRFIRIIDEDNSYVKSQLVHKVDDIWKIDMKTAKYILDRSLMNSNYVIRQIALSKSKDIENLTAK